MKKIIISFVCVLALFLGACQRTESSADIFSTETSSEETTAEDMSSLQDEESCDAPSDEVIVVDICGAVMSEGVYTLPSGSRVHEAIEMAGGLREDADRRLINEARILSDGEQIIVYAEGEEAAVLPAAEGGSGSGAVNINTADETELKQLSGIGEAKAAAIVRERENNGPFKSKEDIMRVSGIGEGMYDRIKDDIIV